MGRNNSHSWLMDNACEGKASEHRRARKHAPATCDLRRRQRTHLDHFTLRGCFVTLS